MATTKELLQAHLAKLRTEKAALLASTADLKKQLHQENVAAEAHTIKARALADQIAAIERPTLTSLSEEISKVAKALGGRAMSDAAS